MEASTTCLTSVASSTSASVWAKFSSTMMARAPESLSWCSSSRGVYSGLTFTTAKPARRMAAMATPYCSRLGIMMATRSPCFKPWACSQAPSWLDSRSTSAKRMRWPMQMAASRSACLRKASFSRSTSEP